MVALGSSYIDRVFDRLIANRKRKIAPSFLRKHRKRGRSRWFTDIVSYKASDILDLVRARTYVHVPRMNGTEPRSVFREIAIADETRSGPCSRFVYFYAKPRRVSLSLCSGWECRSSIIRGVVSFHSLSFFVHTPLSAYVFGSVVRLYVCTRCLLPVARKISPGFTSNERCASIFAPAGIGFVPSSSRDIDFSKEA